MYLIFISLGKSISSFTSHSLLTSTEESLGFSWACKEEGRGQVTWCNSNNPPRVHFQLVKLGFQILLPSDGSLNPQLSPDQIWMNSQ